MSAAQNRFKPANALAGGGATASAEDMAAPIAKKVFIKTFGCQMN